MSMQFQFEQPPEGEDRPAFLSKPGFYHVAVMAQNPQPIGSNQQYIDGLEITFGVLAGTHPDQFDSSFESTFIKGNKNHSDGGRFCNLKLFKLFNALGLLGEHVPGQQTTLDTARAVGRQCVIEVEAKKNSEKAKNPEGFHIEFKGAQVFHVDDPAVKDVPKHPQYMAVIPKELRRDASTFKKEAPAGNAAASAGSSAPSQAEPPKQRLSVAQMLTPGVGAGVGSAASAVDTSDV